MEIKITAVITDSGYWRLQCNGLPSTLPTYFPLPKRTELQTFPEGKQFTKEQRERKPF